MSGDYSEQQFIVVFEHGCVVEGGAAGLVTWVERNDEMLRGNLFHRNCFFTRN